MNNAKNIPCDVLYKTNDPLYEESIRKFQGCPTIALTPKGRIYLGWYAGGRCEPHMENYNLLTYSDDDGQSWSKPLLVIPSSKEHFVHALDIQLWIDPAGRLHVYWVQNNTSLAPENTPKAEPWQPIGSVDGYLFGDFTHAWWEMICDEPDSDEPKFSEPRYLDIGFLRCKPLVLANGDWLNFNYDQTDGRYGYSVSHDNGSTYEHSYGSKKLDTYFDEAMAYQLRDGTVRMLARTVLGAIAESYSYDNARSWSEAKLTEIDSPNTRFYISRTPSGRILLVNNDDKKSRTNMTLYLSEDDGATWKYKLCIDDRRSLSYPDVDFFDGKIYLTYDRERIGAAEILLAVFTEDDIINGIVPEIRIVSKP